MKAVGEEREESSQETRSWNMANLVHAWPRAEHHRTQKTSEVLKREGKRAGEARRNGGGAGGGWRGRRKGRKGKEEKSSKQERDGALKAPRWPGGCVPVPRPLMATWLGLQWTP